MRTTPKAFNSPTAGPRQIVLGCDGTNNTLTGGSHDTNVLKLIGQLVPEGPGQILYYDPGVGAPDQLPPLGLLNDLNRKRERLAGLANGKGIYENIAEAYLFLVDTWEPGDQIYLFGFSRGAFTARCVAGMVNLFGIIRTDSKPLILTLIRVYFSTPSANRSPAGWWSGAMARRAQRRRQNNAAVARATGIDSPDTSARAIATYLARTKERRSTREEVVAQVRAQFATADGARAAVHFVGVWDTVESVGMPLRRRAITGDATTRTKPGLRHIRHAVSMDEHRLSFAARLYWDDDYTIDDGADPANARSLRQRWFRGVHSDVGGGYDTNEAGLSDQAYRWMLNEAIACGLRTDPKRERSEHVPKPLIAHDACYATPWWGVAGLTVRSNVTHRAGGRAQRVPVLTEGAASDANSRIYSVWRAVLRVAHWQSLVALACCVALFGVVGWLGANALGLAQQGSAWSRIWQGALGLARWQAGFIVDPGGAALSTAPAALATLADFGLIVAYSWLLGLYGTWAFHALTARHDPRNKVPWHYKLGYAPLCLVLADVAENILTLLTLGCLARGLPTLALGCGLLLMLASAIKWLGAAASIALVVSGIAAKTRAWATSAWARNAAQDTAD